MRWIGLLAILGSLISCGAQQSTAEPTILPTAVTTAMPQTWRLSYVQQPLTTAHLIISGIAGLRTIDVGVNGPACFSQGRLIYTTKLSSTNRLLATDVNTRQTETLVDDPAVVLSQATCHPSSDQVLYLRSPLELIDDEPAPPSIWQTTLNQRQPQSLDAAQTPALNQQWSPDGKWLIYELADRPNLVLQAATGETRELTFTGTFTWQPDSQALIIAQLTEPAAGRFGRLVRYDLATEQIQVVLESADADVYYPRLAPDGQQLAYIRRLLGVEVGDLWLLNLNNPQPPRQLTDDPRYDNFDPQWSPDSQQLLWSRLDPQQARYSIWQQSITAPTASQFADDAIWPRWLP
ncbi:TolB-like translocation protein [Herpetosiphon geysericola]|uniref:Uncharacterized protein n=1 Tax=Herpetosiphon geysericola TaxID=70996 RepID=A0A0P6YK25_9CHLR|nr:PD40 domain-containing protein [Herpetosiphon geysericola]KPL90100.1 hypothetical protein SE18_07730 [Herpetosiphon geysericola]